MGAYESAAVPDQVVSDNLVGRTEDSSLELSVYPNPVRGAAVVVLRSDLGGLAVVKVYDQQGRKVVSLFEGLIMPGGLKEPCPGRSRARVLRDSSKCRSQSGGKQRRES